MSCDNRRPVNARIDLMMLAEYILTLSCVDQRGIVHRVSGFLAERGCNILDSAQFGDAQSSLFFMRVHFSADVQVVSDAQLRADFSLLAASMQLNAQLNDARKKTPFAADGVAHWTLFERSAVSLSQWFAAGRNSGDRIKSC